LKMGFSSVLSPLAHSADLVPALTPICPERPVISQKQGKAEHKRTVYHLEKRYKIF